MNTITKNRLFSTLIAMLLAANICTMVAFWLHAERPAPPPATRNAAEFLIRELQLDSGQQQRYRQLRDVHRAAANQLQVEIRRKKDALFALLQKDSTSDREVQDAAADAAKKEAELEVLTFRHFQQVRSICTAEQKRTLDKLLGQALEMLGRTGGPPPSPPPPPDGRAPNGGAPDAPPPS